MTAARAPRTDRRAASDIAPRASASPLGEASLAAPVASPARALQHGLAEALATPTAPHWSARASLALFFGLSGSFWLLVALAFRFLPR
jgi:hypothetical protein